MRLVQWCCFKGRTRGLSPSELKQVEGIIVKQEFMVNEVRVQLFMDVDGIEVHVMGKTQGVNEDGMYWFSVRLNGEVEEYVSPLTTENEAEFFVYGAIASAVFGYSEHVLLAAQGYDNPDTLEFNRLYVEIRDTKQELYEMGIVLPFDPTHERWIWIPQLFALAPMLGTPEVTYSPNGAIARVDYRNYGVAYLEEDSVYYNEGELTVAYLWRLKKRA